MEQLSLDVSNDIKFGPYNATFMKINKKLFSLFFPVLIFMGCHLWSQQPIDRFSLVNRHNVTITEMDPLSPLTVGNGNFAFTADVTGLQTFENYYYQHGIPLETLSTWAWHTFPDTGNYRMEDAMKEYNFHGRKIAYASLEKTIQGQYFRQNPNPIPLGQISFVGTNNQLLDTADIHNIHQQLDLWTGIIYSKYDINRASVMVETVSHPSLSSVAVKIKSNLLKSGGLKPCFRFPYSYKIDVKNKPPFDWNHPTSHQTIILKQTANSLVLKRSIDDSTYFVTIQWKGAKLLKVKTVHEYVLEGTNSDSLLFTCTFSATLLATTPDFYTTKAESSKAWKNFWNHGGAIDLSESTDPRAKELERRIVLSQYLMKVNYSGSFPPQESGLTHLTWYGKHNSEMYWWHTAQFCQWGRPELLENSLQWYLRILPRAKAQAMKEGFEGTRWPKMTGIDGEPSPGGINPFIIWNQPNPIYLAELVYRAKPSVAVLKKYGNLVSESAKFLASYAYYDKMSERYILGPPIKSVNEKNAEDSTQNPGFELAYWYYGLSIAQEWQKRLGLPSVQKWDDILQKLARMSVRDSLYLELETEPDMYKNKGGVSSSMLLALGYLPQTPMVDTAIMHRTFKKIIERNGMKSFVSWSMGKGAMTAARLGEQKIAVDILCNDSPNARFLKNGHVQRAKDPFGSPAYLPVNSSFLSAVALMAAGWDGAPKGNAPGFPQDGSWKVKWEGLEKLP